MFVDIAELEDGAKLETELCIVGAGAAGLAIAQAYLGTNVKVCVLESGGLNGEDAAQALADADMVGHADKPMQISRHRGFGGTTTLWGGACTPLLDIDFAERPWVPDSGWPFGRDALAPDYARAQELLDLGPFDYEPAHWKTRRIRFLEFDGSSLATRMWQLSPRTNFGKKYRAAMQRAANVTVLLHATAAELITDAGGRSVERVALRGFDGKRAEVRARIVVLAGGAIENPRLLLLSRGTRPQGLGNDRDLVGRYFMQHPHRGSASVEFTGSRRWIASYKEFKKGRQWARARLALSEAAQARLHTLNCVATLIERHISEQTTHAESVGYVALKRIVLDTRKGRVPLNLRHEIGSVLGNLDGIAVGLWRYLFHRGGALHVMAEQAPNPDSRITLGDAKDRLGLPRARIDWRLTARDRASILTTVTEIGREFERLGIGRVRPDPWLLDAAAPWPAKVHGGYHHMGTTRMADDPQRGVVDANARVHGVDNLFVAGASVFPTVGCANPTLTIVALSLRLAEHLKPLLGA